MDTRPHSELTCDQAAELIDSLVDDRLEPAGQDRLDQHLAACAACRGLAADFREIRGAASTLPVHHPRPEVWARIAQSMTAEKPRPVMPFWTGARVALAMAAVLVLSVVTSVVVMRGSWGPAADTTTSASAVSATTAAGPVHLSPEDVVKDVDEHLRIAEAHYDAAISGLEKVVKTEQAALDPAVAATLQKNIGIIDKAITESREAIKTQPTSQLAQTSLFEALRQKVALLEDTIALINVMRKGDQAGAAKIISGLSKS